MRRKNQKGRSSTGGKFTRLSEALLNSDAWKCASPAERSVYTVMRSLYNGSNNGRIGLGARQAALLANISKNTSTSCFATLVERGLVECVTPGGFSTNSRRQTEWRLTDERCDVSGSLPSKAFMRWRATAPKDLARVHQFKTKSQNRDAQVPIEGQSEAERCLSVPELGRKPLRAAA